MVGANGGFFEEKPWLSVHQTHSSLSEELDVFSIHSRVTRLSVIDRPPWKPPLYGVSLRAGSWFPYSERHVAFPLDMFGKATLTDPVGNIKAPFTDLPATVQLRRLALKHDQLQCSPPTPDEVCAEIHQISWTSRNMTSDVWDAAFRRWAGGVI